MGERITYPKSKRKSMNEKQAEKLTGEIKELRKSIAEQSRLMERMAKSFAEISAALRSQSGRTPQVTTAPSQDN